MKTNRQNKPTFTNPKHNKAGGFVPAHITCKKNTHQPERQTLASLLSNHHISDTVILICQEKIVISIQEKKDTQLRFRLPVNTNSNKTCIVYTGPGQSNLLKKIYHEYQDNTQMQFVFAAKNYLAEVKQFRVSQGDTKASFLSKTYSEKELEPFLPLPKQHTSKPFQTKLQSAINIPHEDTSQFKRCLSQKIKDSNPKKDEMFTVEQLKQSMQSQIKESLKSHQEKENFKDINRLQNDLRPDLGSRKNEVDMPGLVSFAREEKQKIEDLKTIQPLPFQSTQPKQKISVPVQSQNHDIQSFPEIRVKECQQESGFSLTTHLRKGLIQGSSSSASQQLSFKIAGDEFIQGQKRRNDELELQQMSHIEEYSSIISNAREDIFKKETEQQQLDSIRCEIEDLNRCFHKNPKKLEFEMIQKVDLNKLAHQREQGLDSNIEISEKVVNPLQNVSQFMVKYNVRFLQKKNEQTEIVRLSPLRFRKKEEVVHTLLKAKIIPKQSDSINIS